MTAFQYRRRAVTALCASAVVAVAATLNATSASAAAEGISSTTEGISSTADGSSSPWHGSGRRWGYDARVSAGTTTAEISKIIGADDLGGKGYTGKGVGIAMIDTGIAKVPGLTGKNIVNGPDLSFESQNPATQYIDGFGHGTHLAGIMVGNDPKTGFKGIAPDAKLTSIKVAASDGSVDVILVLAAIDWVIQHRDDDAKNPIKVISLAYGTEGTADYKNNPLAYAVEQAWKAGIVVVVAGGNDGASVSSLVNPAFDPYVISVGAIDDKGTTSTQDDSLSDFSSRGNSQRRVDFSAPGRSVVSLRAPGSFIDVTYPSARVGTSLFKGSGTSQTSAVVAGAIADMLSARPYLTPDQVKAQIRTNTRPLSGSGQEVAAAGAGGLQVYSATVDTQIPGNYKQSFTPSTGAGTLESARGTSHVVLDGAALTGEKDIFGNAFSTAAWAKASAARTAWSGGKWMGVAWVGDTWATTNGVTSWTGRAWSGRAWSGGTWNGRAWSGDNWNGAEWGTGS
jgi:serine protease AprX